MPVLMALRNAKDTLLGQQLRAIGAVDGLALVRRHVGDLLRRHRPAGAHRADNMRHPPDRILVGHQELVAAPRQAVRLVEVLDMPVDPPGFALAVVAQQRQIAGALLGHQNIAIGQHQHPTRVDEPAREHGRGEARRHGWHLAAIRDDQHPVRDDRTGFRRRQIVRLDVETAADLVLDRKILSRRVCRGFVLRRGGFLGPDRGKHQAERRQDGQSSQPPGHVPRHRLLPEGRGGFSGL